MRRQAWDLRCEIREKTGGRFFLQKDMREALPRENAPTFRRRLTVYDDVPLRPAEAGSSH